MRHFRVTIPMIIGCGMLVGCASTTSVLTDYDREADFSTYNTYYWSDEFQMKNGSESEQEPLFYNTLNKKRLKQAIEEEMEARGYALSGTDPDLLVNAHVVVQQAANEWNYNPYPFYSFYYPAPAHRQSTEDKQGDIVIELIDPKEHQLVWQGYARGVLDTNTEDRVEEIRDAVDLIFAKYGRRAGQSGQVQPGK